MSQMVHVVSMLDVPSLFGSVSFQSKDVKGAQNSLFLFCINTQLVGNNLRLLDACNRSETTKCMQESPPSLPGFLLIVSVLIESESMTESWTTAGQQLDNSSNITAEATQQHSWVDSGSYQPIVTWQSR